MLEHWRLIALCFIIGVAGGFWLNSVILHPATEVLVTGIATLASGAIAAGAAIWASNMTGEKMALVETAKHEREVEALKAGLVEEMSWTVEQIAHGLTPINRRGEEIRLWRIRSQIITGGFPVFERNADKIALAGSKFAGPVVSFYSHLRMIGDASNPLVSLDVNDIPGLIKMCLLANSQIDHSTDTYERASKVVKDLAATFITALHDVANIRLTDEQASDINEFLSSDVLEAFGHFSAKVPKFVLVQTQPKGPHGLPSWKASGV
ncbi:hypothetical protein QMT40_002974 [Parvibaculaceae bacterium PLY_AMNH_Bact1]|nr:hypothetical protein QMT40_002974 [Parvibaculaceae bacterium PLY_AMNH_Bact1]